MKALMKKTDHELINLFVDGNLEALEILVLRHKDKLYTSILFLVKDKYLAEDIFQDVFIRIIDTMRSGRYTEEGKFLPWAMRIAHNLCVDYFRKVKRTPTIKNGDDKDIFEVLNFTEDGVDTRMMKRQSYDRVREMLDRGLVDLAVQGGEATLAFRDRGPGFSDHVLEHPFEPYVTTKAKGTGLGLAIVKKIVDEHAGRVTLENAAPHGARVTLAFRALKGADSAAAAPATVGTHS